MRLQVVGLSKNLTKIIALITRTKFSLVKLDMKFRTKLHRYSKGNWAIGLSLIHIPNETVAYFKLFKWCLMVGYMGPDWV